MAYVSNYNPNEDQQNQAQGPIAPGGASNTVKLSPTGGVGSVGGTPSLTGANSGGQFASLNQYVNANQGQAQPLANQIVGGIANQYNTLQGQNQQTLQGIQGQVSAGSTPENQSILQQEAADPVSFASNPGNVTSFQGQLNDKYTGPTSAESNPNYQSQLANVNTAINEGNAQVGTDTGRQQLLQGIEAAPTAGVTGLNSAILAQAPNSQAQIEQAYQPFSNLTSQLSTGAQGIDTSIGQAQSGAADAAAKANAQIASQSQGLQSNLQNEYNTAQNQVNSYNAGINAASPKVNTYNQNLPAFENAISAFNATPQLGDTLAQQFGLGQIANPNLTAVTLPGMATMPTLEQTATPQDVATQQALEQLGNISPVFNPSQAGTFTNPGTFANPFQGAQAFAPTLSNIYNNYTNEENYSNQQGGGPDFSGLLQAYANLAKSYGALGV